MNFYFYFATYINIREKVILHFKAYIYIYIYIYIYSFNNSKLTNLEEKF